MKDVRALDGISFADWFKGHGGTQQSIDRMWDPIGEERSGAPAAPMCAGWASACAACGCAGARACLQLERSRAARRLPPPPLPCPPAAYALGFLDCKDISARCMLSIFQFFATKTGALPPAALCSHR